MGIVLASRSPRRRQLLEQMGLRDCRIVCSDADETASPGLTPPALVEALSARKAAAVQHAAAAGDLIIAADTVVALDGRVLGKPADGPDAFAMLSALSGRRHQVYTGLTVVCGAQRLTEHEVTAVTFRSLSSAEICAYIATGEPMDKAGAYGIQGRGALFVEGIEGDYYNVMGLPVCRLGRILARLGVDCARLWSEL